MVLAVVPAEVSPVGTILVVTVIVHPRYTNSLPGV